MKILKTPLQVDACIKCPHKVSRPTGGGFELPILHQCHIHNCTYSNIFFTQNNNNKNKTIIIRVNNAHARRRKQNTIRYTCFLRFDRATSLLLKWAVGPLQRPFTTHSRPCHLLVGQIMCDFILRLKLSFEQTNEK